MPGMDIEVLMAVPMEVTLVVNMVDMVVMEDMDILMLMVHVHRSLLHTLQMLIQKPLLLYLPHYPKEHMCLNMSLEFMFL